MTERKEHFDEDLDLRVSAGFSEDLRTLFKPQLSVPSEVDRVVIDKCHQHFIPKHWSHRIFQHVSLWRIAAAAAVIIFAFSLNLTKKPGPSTSRSVLAEAQAVDIDRNGRVDILDAFKLARHIESANRHIESANRTDKKWDINEDGVVNGNDVDLVASAAVSLPLQKQGPG